MLFRTELKRRKTVNGSLVEATGSLLELFWSGGGLKLTYLILVDFIPGARGVLYAEKQRKMTFSLFIRRKEVLAGNFYK